MYNVYSRQRKVHFDQTYIKYNILKNTTYDIFKLTNISIVKPNKKYNMFKIANFRTICLNNQMNNIAKQE